MIGIPHRCGLCQFVANRSMLAGSGFGIQEMLNVYMLDCIYYVVSMRDSKSDDLRSLTLN